MKIYIYIYTIFQQPIFFSPPQKERERRRKGKREDDIEENVYNLDGGDINEGKKRKKETERTRWRIVTDPFHLIEKQLVSSRKFPFAMFSNRCC